MRVKPEGAINCPYFPDKYWITPDAKIWHKHYNPTQKGPNPCSRYKNGYLEYYLVDYRGNKRHAAAHRAFALAYIPNPDNKPEVDFLDGSRTNISLENLRWSDRFENRSHEYYVLKTMKTSHLWEKDIQDKRRASSLIANRVKAKKIDQYDAEGNFMKTWETASDVGAFYNCSQQNILPECKRNFPRLKKGYYWRFKGDPLDMTKCKGKLKKGGYTKPKNDKTDIVYKTFLDAKFDTALTAQLLGLKHATVYYHLRKLSRAIRVYAIK